MDGKFVAFSRTRENIERALTWISTFGDPDQDGYIEYERRSGVGLTNQGWRDSWDGMPNADGTLARPPIAALEAQAYVYRAKVDLADLFHRAGDPERAKSLLREAEDLRLRLNRDFWLEDKGFYALALQASKEPVDSFTSNPGHVLWSGIAEEDKAEKTVRRLMSPDMFSGWGVRTLSDREITYNPTGYHLGTVWPHDNSIIAAGFKRYGFNEETMKLVDGVIGAAMLFSDYRLPELFMGFSRSEYGVPVSYPVACRPQAWAAGSVPYLVRTMLGLVADGFERRLRIVRPVLPEFVHHLEVHRLQVADCSVDLRFDRAANGNVAVDVLGLRGPLTVSMELHPPRRGRSR